MALIGDLIVAARASFGDPAQTLLAPSLATPPIAIPIGGGTLPNVTWLVQVTTVNPWGESIPTAQFQLPGPAASTSFQVNLQALPTGATFWNIYFTASGQPLYVVSVPASLLTFAVTTLTGALVKNAVPVVNNAYDPDSNGGMISAYLIYQWLNGALNIGSGKVEGLLDIGGVQAINTQNNYTIDSHWRKIDHAFFDGWPLGLGTRDNVFRHTLVNGIPGWMIAQRQADKIVVELYPQPNRTGGNGATSGATTATATSIVTAANTLSTFLPFGICQIGNETISYGGITGNTLTGCVRGLTGTVAQAWPNGTAVTEFNIQIQGRRDPTLYSVGSALTPLLLPVGWEELLQTYMLHKYSLSQQNWAEAKDQLSAFAQGMDDLEGDDPVESPTQLGGVGWGGYGGIETVGLTGSLIIP